MRATIGTRRVYGIGMTQTWKMSRASSVELNVLKTRCSTYFASEFFSALGLLAATTGNLRVTLKVNLNEECFSVFFPSIFPKFRYIPIIGKNRQMPKFRENTEINLKNSPR